MKLNTLTNVLLGALVVTQLPHLFDWISETSKHPTVDSAVAACDSWAAKGRKFKYTPIDNYSLVPQIKETSERICRVNFFEKRVEGKVYLGVEPGSVLTSREYSDLKTKPAKSFRF